MIFPVNERVVVLGRELDGLGVGREDFGDERDGEVRRCLGGGGGGMWGGLWRRFVRGWRWGGLGERMEG